MSQNPYLGRGSEDENKFSGWGREKLIYIKLKVRNRRELLEKLAGGDVDNNLIINHVNSDSIVKKQPLGSWLIPELF